MRPNYKSMRKNIPSSVKIGRRTKFAVEWHDDLGKSANGKNIYGITEFAPNVIKLWNGQEDDEDAVKSFWHECLHMTDLYKKGQNLSEKQVMKLESRFEYFNDIILTLNKDCEIVKKTRKKNAKT